MRVRLADLKGQPPVFLIQILVREGQIGALGGKNKLIDQVLLSIRGFVKIIGSVQLVTRIDVDEVGQSVDGILMLCAEAVSRVQPGVGEDLLYGNVPILNPCFQGLFPLRCFDTNLCQANVGQGSLVPWVQLFQRDLHGGSAFVLGRGNGQALGGGGLF